MQKQTGNTKLAVSKLSMIPADVKMSVAAGEIFTNSLGTDVLAVEVSAAISKLAMSILVKFTNIGFHVQMQGCSLGGDNWRPRGELDVVVLRFTFLRVSAQIELLY